MSERDGYSFSNRSILANALEEDMESIAEKDLLVEYKKTVKQIETDQDKLQEVKDLIGQIYSQGNSDYYSIKKDLQESEIRIIERINSNDRKLINLETTTALKNVLEREKKKMREKAEQEDKELLAKYRERAMREQEELMQQYQKRVEENRRKREESKISQEPLRVSKKSVQKELKRAERQKKVNKIKIVFASIPLSILGALEVHLIYGITNLIIALMFLLISYIPIIKNIVGYLLAVGDNTPDAFAMFVATMIAYVGFNATAEHIIKKIETQKLTLMLTGIFLTIFNVLFVIINLKYNDPILGNVLLAIAGIVIFYKGKNT